MRFVRWPPALLVYTEHLPEGVGGQARGPLVLIRTKYECDQGIHQHELEHVRQFYALWGITAAINTPIAWWLAAHFTVPFLAPDIASWSVAATVALVCAGAHGWLYAGSRRYRMAAEVAAYCVQMQYPQCNGGRLSLVDAAFRLANARYELGLTVEMAIELLKGETP